jgi:hypothetical protein
MVSKKSRSRKVVSRKTTKKRPLMKKKTSRKKSKKRRVLKKKSTRKKTKKVIMRGGGPGDHVSVNNNMFDNDLTCSKCYETIKINNLYIYSAQKYYHETCYRNRYPRQYMAA